MINRPASHRQLDLLVFTVNALEIEPNLSGGSGEVMALLNC